MVGDRHVGLEVNWNALSVRGVTRVRVAATFVAVALLVPDAVAEHRVALAIGNADYKSIGTLANPGNDARLLAGTLRSVGFTLVGEGA